LALLKVCAFPIARKRWQKMVLAGLCSLKGKRLPLSIDSIDPFDLELAAQEMR
jgi:hypothetical protein